MNNVENLHKIMKQAEARGATVKYSITADYEDIYPWHRNGPPNRITKGYLFVMQVTASYLTLEYKHYVRECEWDYVYLYRILKSLMQ